jgi:peptide/nickel transport system permease protein
VTAYIIRRIIVGIGLLLAMSLVTFLMFFAGGDPSRSLCTRQCTPERVAAIGKNLGYDQPVYRQYGDFLKGIVAGRDYPSDPEYRAQIRKAHPELITHCAAPCLGYSESRQQTVNSLIKDAIPVTVSVSIVAFVVWIFFGVLLGVTAAVFKGSLTDRGLVAATLVIYAMPTFFVGNFLLKYVALKWQAVRYPEYTPITSGVWNWFTGLLLPAVTLALFFMAGYVRMTRAFVLESLGEDYIRTAKAKGLRPRVILFKHGLRAALTPLVTMAGLDFAALLAGSVITEQVFNFQGLGLLAVSSNSNKDLPTLVALVLMAGAVVIIMNIIVDILYAAIDPRIRVI